MVKEAMDSGYLTLKRINDEKLLNSQRNLISKKGAVWGRLLTMRLLGIPTPRHEGYALFPLWRALPLREKIASIFGTGKRILKRGYRSPDSQILQASTTSLGLTGKEGAANAFPRCDGDPQ
jgi:coenzyme F420 hydrogenase subunit beta